MIAMFPMTLVKTMMAPVVMKSPAGPAKLFLVLAPACLPWMRRNTPKARITTPRI